MTKPHLIPVFAAFCLTMAVHVAGQESASWDIRQHVLSAPS